MEAAQFRPICWRIALGGKDCNQKVSLVEELAKKYQVAEEKDENSLQDLREALIYHTIFDQRAEDPTIATKPRDRAYDLVFLMHAENEEDRKASDTFKRKYNKGGNNAIIEVPPEAGAEFIEETVKSRFMLGDAINCFAGKDARYTVKEFLGPIKLIEIEKSGITILGVHVDRQKDVDFAIFKKEMLSLLKVDNPKIVQVIGDSGRGVFSKAGGAFAAKVLKDELDTCGIINFGITGYALPTGECDVNAIVNAYIDENPEAGKRTMAISPGHVHVAYNRWDYYFSPHIKNFVLVYNDEGMLVPPQYNDKGIQIGGYTVFSSEVPTSDGILEDGDITVCLEGGTQCLAQVMNMLEQSIPVKFILNIRALDKNDHFSVARFIKAIYEASPKTKEEALKACEEYQKSLAKLWDNKRQDNSDNNYQHTKQKLLEDSLQKFVDSELYLKVNPALCTFYDATL